MEERANNYEEEINLWELILIIVKRKNIIIQITGVFIVVSIIYALLATPQYEVKTVLTSKQEKKLPSSISSLSGVASMFGANVSSLTGGGNLNTIKKTLNSSDFLFYFNKKHKVIKKITDTDEELMKEQVLMTISNLIKVSMDEENNTLTVKILYKSPVTAYTLMKNLMDSLNEFLVKKQYEENAKIEKVIKEKIQKTQDPILRAELTKLWSSETKRMLYAKINKNNLYKVIESPFLPEKRVKPKRKMIVIVSTFLGFFISIFLVFFLEFIKNAKKDPENKKYLDKIKENLNFKILNIFRRRK